MAEFDLLEEHLAKRDVPDMVFIGRSSLQRLIEKYRDTKDVTYLQNRLDSNINPRHVIYLRVDELRKVVLT